MFVLIRTLVGSLISPTLIIYVFFFGVAIYLLAPIGASIYRNWNADARALEDLKHTVEVERAGRQIAEQRLKNTETALATTTQTLEQIKRQQQDLSDALDNKAQFETTLRRELTNVRAKLNKDTKDLKTCEQLVAAITRELSALGGTAPNRVPRGKRP